MLRHAKETYLISFRLTNDQKIEAAAAGNWSNHHGFLRGELSNLKPLNYGCNLLSVSVDAGRGVAAVNGVGDAADGDGLRYGWDPHTSAASVGYLEETKNIRSKDVK